jgi:Zn-dependent protease
VLGDPSFLIQRLSVFIPLLLSLSVHEWAHARVALMLGDDTAARLGRCTFSPLAHIDLVGTVLLPLMGAPIGWAKPVPVNPLRFDRKYSMRAGMLLTSLAGPASNVGLAVLCTAVLWVMVKFFPSTAATSPHVARFLLMLIYLNVMLATFNMLPVPPLDGSRLVDYFIPNSLREGWERISRMGPFLLLGLIVLLQMSGLRLFAVPLQLVQGLLRALGI